MWFDLLRSLKMSGSCAASKISIIEDQSITQSTLIRYSVISEERTKKFLERQALGCYDY